MRPPERFETQRLILRPPVPADAPAMFEAWAQDPDVTRFLTWKPHRDVSESEAHIARCTDGWRTDRSFVWFIEDGETGRLIGSIAARVNHGINVGYVLARRAWGRGLMVEALEALVAWCLDQDDIERVWATCDIENRASARVLEKAGFEFEGILRRWDRHPNLAPGRRDARCYSRTR